MIYKTNAILFFFPQSSFFFCFILPKRKPAEDRQKLRSLINQIKVLASTETTSIIYLDISNTLHMKNDHLTTYQTVWFQTNKESYN